MFKNNNILILLALIGFAPFALPVVSFDLLVKGDHKVLVLGDNHNLALNAMNKNHIDSILEVFRFASSQEVGRESRFIYEFDREGLSFDELKAKYSTDLNTTFESVLNFHEHVGDSRLLSFLDFDARNPSDKEVWSGYQLCKYIQFLFANREDSVAKLLPFWPQMIAMSNPGEVDCTVSLKQIYEKIDLEVSRIIDVYTADCFEYELLHGCLVELKQKQDKFQSYVSGLIGNGYFEKPLVDLLSRMVSSTAKELDQKIVVGEFYSQVYSMLEYYADIHWIHEILKSSKKDTNAILLVGVDHAINIKRLLTARGYSVSSQQSLLTPEYLSSLKIGNLAKVYAIDSSGYSRSKLAFKEDFLPNLISATQSFLGIDFPGDLISQDRIKEKYCGECFSAKKLSSLERCAYCENSFFCADSDQCKAHHYRECNMIKYCANCRTTDPDVRLCSGCKKVHYCCSSCQKAHWGKHKIACKLLSQAAAIN